MYPTVAPYRSAVAKGAAPSSSRLRRMRRLERPEPDLKARHLLARAAPCSATDSPEEPALGKVRVTVEVEEASSVTTVRPLGRVDTDGELALAAAGDDDGTLQFQCSKEEKHSQM